MGCLLRGTAARGRPIEFGRTAFADDVEQLVVNPGG